MRRLTLTAVIMGSIVMACSNNNQAPRSRSPEKKDNGQGTINNRDDNGTDVGTSTTYLTDIAPLMTKYECATCHENQQVEPALNTYAQVKSAAKRVLASVRDGSMPQGGDSLKSSEVSLIEKWIKDGSLEKSASTSGNSSNGTGVSGSKVTYQGWVKSFLQAKCLNCHGANGTSPDLSSFASAKAAAQSSYSEMEGGSMPRNAAKIDAASLEKFKSWIDGGRPESDTASTGNTGNTGNTGTTGTTGANLTYDSHIRSWVSDNCLRCHGSGGTRPNLSTKAQVKSSAQSILRSIKTTMPKGNAPMAQKDTSLIENWIAQGMK